MKINELLENKRTLSFEVFPPKYGEDQSIEKTLGVLDELAKLNPDFISVTCGAGGTNNNNNVQIASYIKNNLNITALAHLTGGPLSKENVNEIVEKLKTENIENILALRGDKPVYYTEDYCKDFKHATDLMEYLKNEDFILGGACYPEGHIESESLYSDLENMKKKQDAGAKFFITQVFYDNNYYYRLVNEARRIGITVPIIPGVMPLTSPKSISKVKSMCGSTIPLEYRNMMEVFMNNPKVFRELGYNYTTYQIMDLIAKGAPGIHLYIMNNPKTANEVVGRLTNVIKELF